MRAVNLADPQATPRIFVSYARVDGEEAARDLVKQLSEHNLSTWLDHSGLEGGIDWWRQVEAVLQQVEHLVLMLTPAALKSPNVEREWRYARRQDVQVSPVQIGGTLDLAHLPRWMQKAHRSHLAVREQRQRLLHVLQGPGRTTRVPFMASPPEAGFVPRPEEFAALKRAVLGRGNEPVAITAALRGAGGFGKTELARFLCHDDDIEESFDGGILWATLGETPASPVAALADLTAALRGRRPEATLLDAAKAALAEAIDDRACLLVIDDVWRRGDVAPFLHRGPRDRSTRLITTRDDGVLPRDAMKVPVDAMRPSEAVSLLTRDLPPFPAPLKPRIDDVAQRRLGGWPLLLSQANAFLADRIDRGEPLERAFDRFERSLTARGITGTLRIDDPEDRRRSADGTLDISLGQLADDVERSRFHKLGVFSEDADISLKSIAILWGRDRDSDEFEVDALCGRLRQLSLIRDLGLCSLRLHDVVRLLLRERLGAGELIRLEAALIDGWRYSCAGDWARLTDLYALRFLPTHLASLQQAEELTGLLLDPRWMTIKLAALGAPALLADYRSFAGNPEGAAGLVGRALDLAGGALAEELPAQLLGRLSPVDAPGLGPCLTAAGALVRPGSLVPLRRTLTPPGAELRRFEGHQAAVKAVAVLADNRRALSASYDGTLRLWDLDSGAELRCLEGDSDFAAFAVLADDRRALSVSYDHMWRLWDLDSGTELRRFKGHGDPVSAVAVLADNRRALSASGDVTSPAGDHSLRLWDLDGGAELRRFDGHGHWATAVAVLADNRRALSASWDNTLRLWDLNSGAELRRLEGHEGPVTAIAVLADNRRALSASFDNTLRLWDLDSGAELRRFEGHGDHFKAVAVLADNRRALSASWDKTLHLWDLDSGTELRRFEGHSDQVNAVAVLADNRRAVSASNDHTLRLWDLDSDAESRHFEGHDRGVNAIAVLADDRRALSASADRSLRLWDLDTGTELRRFEGHRTGVWAVAVLADSRRALSASDDRSLRLWDLDNGAELRRFEGHQDWVRAVAVLADNRHALSASADHSLRLWDLDRGAELRLFEGHDDRVWAVAVLPDNRRALSGSEDGWLRLWDLDTGAELRRFKGHDRGVNAIAVLADNRRALSASDDCTVRLWDLDKGVELCRFEGHRHWVRAVAVLADNRRAVSASADRSLRLWDLDNGGTLATLHLDVALDCLAVDGRDRMVVGDTRGRLHPIGIQPLKRN
jgi:WD40 repeat protein